MDSEARLVRLERSVRWHRRALLAAVGLGLVAASGVAVPEVIQAERFEVVNDQGKVVALIESMHGRGVLSIMDENGKIVVLASALPGTIGNYGTLATFYSDGRHSASLRQTDDGHPSIAVHAANGKMAVEIAGGENLSPLGGGVIKVFDRLERSVCRIHAKALGKGEVLTEGD